MLSRCRISRFFIGDRSGVFDYSGGPRRARRWPARRRATVTRQPSYRRVIERRRSWRSYALNALLRLTMRGRLAPDADLVGLRRYYQRLDARRFRLDPDIGHTPVDCGGVIGEWIVVPQTR